MNGYGQLGGGHARYETTPQAVIGTPFATHHSIGGVLSGLAPGNGIILRNNGGDGLMLSANGSSPSRCRSPMATPTRSWCLHHRTSEPELRRQQWQRHGRRSRHRQHQRDLHHPGLHRGRRALRPRRGTTVVLQNNGADDRSLSANGSFVFATALADGSSYSVSVRTQHPPARPAPSATAAGRCSVRISAT